METQFQALSSLVLVDVMAALPMEHVVRMAGLGHVRLQQASFLKWVMNRMSNVNFVTAAEAIQTRSAMAQSLISNEVMKRLEGKVVITHLDREGDRYLETCVQLCNLMPGRLHLHLEDISYSLENEHGPRVKKILSTRNTVKYTSQIIVYSDGTLDMEPMSNEMVFDYRYFATFWEHNVLYRPALLNGRHIVDVLRAICGPADVSEAEMDRVRTEATKNASEYMEGDEDWEGVWLTHWRGGAVTAAVELWNFLEKESH